MAMMCAVKVLIGEIRELVEGEDRGLSLDLRMEMVADGKQPELEQGFEVR